MSPQITETVIQLSSHTESTVGSSENEETLARRLLQGDVGALEALFELHAGRLRKLARCFGLDEQSAEDALQDTFLRAWKAHQAAPSDSARLNSWLTSIAANYCRAELTKRGLWRRVRRILAGEKKQSSMAGPVETTSEMDELNHCAKQALQELDPDDRMIVVLAWVEDLNSPQIGKILGLNSGTVRVRLCRALQQVRRRMEELGV